MLEVCYLDYYVMVFGIVAFGGFDGLGDNWA